MKSNMIPQIKPTPLPMTWAQKYGVNNNKPRSNPANFSNSNKVSSFLKNKNRSVIYHFYYFYTKNLIIKIFDMYL